MVHVSLGAIGPRAGLGTIGLGSYLIFSFVVYLFIYFVLSFVVSFILSWAGAYNWCCILEITREKRVRDGPMNLILQVCRNVWFDNWENDFDICDQIDIFNA